ncbi:hypothetical protein J4206_01615, partial [Candidatus Woesearchaeota archaeon]|nr:hypothetical protein [Candidatus Woesearchaeota archaeon]
KISDLEIYKDKNGNNEIDYDEGEGADDPADYLEDNVDVSNNKALQDEFEPPGDYIVDPTSGIIRAAQCVCVPAIVAYLTFWKGALDAVKKCFQSVLITKKAQSGLCKSVLTVYICDMIWDVISCITKKYSAGAGVQVKADGIGGFFAAMSGASNDVQNSIVNRYGESAIYKNLFSERKLINALCVGAFTGDWDIDVQQFLQGQVKIPIASQGWVPTATRRFITADPNNEGLATYIYHIGAGLIAGSDVDWSLELLCSNNNDCNQGDNDAEGNACDCAQGSRPGEQAIRIDGGRLRAGESIGGTDEQGDRYIPLTHRIRYDKVRLRWSYQDNNGKSVTDEVVNPISFTGSPPPLHCKFKVAEMSFNCGAAIGELGTFKFVEKPRPKKQVYTIDDPIKLDAQIIKKSPNYNPGKEDARIAGLINVQTSAKADPNKQIPKWVVFTLFNQHNSIVNIKRGAASEPAAYVLTGDGTYSTEAQVTGADSDALNIDWLLPDGYKISREDFRKILGKGDITQIFVKDGEKPLPALEASYDIQQGSATPWEFAVVAQKEKDKVMCYVKDIETSSTAQNAPASGTTQAILQEKNLVDPKDCTKGAGITYQNIRIIVPLKSVNDINTQTPKKAIAAFYNPPKSDGGDPECTGEKVQWRLEMALHHGLKENENFDWSATNFKKDTPGEIAQSKGALQAYRGNDAIMIDVICNQNAGNFGQGSSSNNVQQTAVTNPTDSALAANNNLANTLYSIMLNSWSYDKKYRCANDKLQDMGYKVEYEMNIKLGYRIPVIYNSDNSVFNKQDSTWKPTNPVTDTGCEDSALTNLNTRPFGILEPLDQASITGYMINGWAYDADKSAASIKIRIELKNSDGVIADTSPILTASMRRPDLAKGNFLPANELAHGFTYTVASNLPKGIYTVDVYAQDSGNNNNWVKIRGSGKTITIGRSNLPKDSNIGNSAFA